MIWKLLLLGEQHFRRLKGAEWLPAVLSGTRFVDGKLVEEQIAEGGRRLTRLPTY